jgi:hypothetical protein
VARAPCVADDQWRGSNWPLPTAATAAISTINVCNKLAMVEGEGEGARDGRGAREGEREATERIVGYRLRSPACKTAASVSSCDHRLVGRGRWSN